MYLTVHEAQQLRISLETLLANPEAKEHEHVLGNGFLHLTHHRRQTKRSCLLLTEDEGLKIPVSTLTDWMRLAGL